MQNSSRFILTCFQMRLKDDAFMCPKFQRVFFLSAFAAPSILNIWIRHRCDTRRWVCLCGTRCKASQRWMKVLEMKTPRSSCVYANKDRRQGFNVEPPRLHRAPDFLFKLHHLFFIATWTTFCISNQSLHGRRLRDAPHLHPRPFLLLPAGTVGAVGGAAI